MSGGRRHLRAEVDNSCPRCRKSSGISRVARIFPVVAGHESDRRNRRRFPIPSPDPQANGRAKQSNAGTAGSGGQRQVGVRARSSTPVDVVVSHAPWPPETDRRATAIAIRVSVAARDEVRTHRESRWNAARRAHAGASRPVTGAGRKSRVEVVVTENVTRVGREARADPRNGLGKAHGHTSPDVYAADHEAWEHASQSEIPRPSSRETATPPRWVCHRDERSR
jgi:hypothetical protein